MHAMTVRGEVAVRGVGRNVAGGACVLGLLAAKLRHKRIAQVANHLAREGQRTMSGIEQNVQLLHQIGALTCGDRFKQSFEDRVGHRSHQLANLIGGQHSMILRIARRRSDRPLRHSHARGRRAAFTRSASRSTWAGRYLRTCDDDGAVDAGSKEGPGRRCQAAGAHVAGHAVTQCCAGRCYGAG